MAVSNAAHCPSTMVDLTKVSDIKPRMADTSTPFTFVKANPVADFTKQQTHHSPLKRPMSFTMPHTEINAQTQVNPMKDQACEYDDETRRVTVWNPKTGKKLSGNAGVFKRNLAKYLRTHPDW